MSDAKERLGFIGLGIIGRRMARSLLRVGYELTAYDVRRDAVNVLAKDGARAADSPLGVAAECDALITMLPDSPEVESVYLGPGGVLARLESGVLAIDMSSIAPRVSRTLAQIATNRGIEMMDAPVSGATRKR
jgi:2-hydroxy-3-oxopropionate reductase